MGWSHEIYLFLRHRALQVLKQACDLNHPFSNKSEDFIKEWGHYRLGYAYILVLGGSGANFANIFVAAQLMFFVL